MTLAWSGPYGPFVGPVGDGIVEGSKGRQPSLEQEDVGRHSAVTSIMTELRGPQVRGAVHGG